MYVQRNHFAVHLKLIQHSESTIIFKKRRRKMIQLFWKTTWHFLINLTIYLPVSQQLYSWVFIPDK